MSEASQWVSVSEAAAASAVSERTLWRWVRDGTVESRQESRGQQRTRLVNRESLPEESRTASAAVSAPSAAVSGNGSGWPDTAGHGGDGQGRTGTAEESRPAAAPLACPCCKVRESEAEQLRTQLQRRDQAEAQLRMLLMQLERTNAELAGALVMKALPAAQARPDQPRRVRWWFWRR